MRTACHSRVARVEGLVIAHYDPETGLYRVAVTDGYSAMSFSNPWIAARTGIVIAGELGASTRATEQETSVP